MEERCVSKIELCLIAGLMLLGGFLNHSLFSGDGQEYSRFAIYYSNKLPASAFDEYELLVFDSDYYPNLRILTDRGKTLLGYISLGEVEENRTYFNEVKKEGILLQENQYWKGSYFVDLRDPRWTERVVERLVPRILNRGFHGIFLDTLDNPAHLERTDPKKYKGMVTAAVHLVKTIRYHYPSIKIMLNRAYEILPRIEGDIDMVLGESVFTDYNFDTESYGHVEKESYQFQIQLLQAARERTQKLQVFTLDYWNPDDQDEIRKIYQEQRANGFIPYVSTIDLDRLLKEPRE